MGNEIGVMHLSFRGRRRHISAAARTVIAMTLLASLAIAGGAVSGLWLMELVLRAGH